LKHETQRIKNPPLAIFQTVSRRGILRTSPLRISAPGRVGSIIDRGFGVEASPTRFLQ
jgi:hypothetical protein